jgi:hypothetical protein
MATRAGGAAAPSGSGGRDPTAPSGNGGSDQTAHVDVTRAWTGLIVVVAGDVAIAVAAILGVLKVFDSGSSAGATIAVSILTSAFTAVGTMTTAYFGIRASSNTANRTIDVGRRTG